MTTNAREMTRLQLVLGLLAVSVHAKEFRIYWNIPTVQCHKYKLGPVDAPRAYQILQNDGDSFRGNYVSILYDPGLFPALLENVTQLDDYRRLGNTPPLIRRNGGVPQAGNLNQHLANFSASLDALMPNTTNDGLAIIDFESWRPVYRQNFGTLQPYKTLSEELLRKQHPLWPKAFIEAEAKRTFEEAGRAFMLDTLQLAKRLRPNATWGYYGLPFCFNGKDANVETCALNIRQENDGTRWLYDASTAIYPSVYMSENGMRPEHRVPMVRGRVKEAKRLARPDQSQKVIVYHWYMMRDTRRYLTEAETLNAFNAMKQMGADGVILWGASADLNSKAKCQQFYNYLETVLGPVARSFGTTYNVQHAMTNE